jgi:hypothetical protein
VEGGVKVRNDKIEGPYVIAADLQMAGMITVGATVQSGVTLELTGTISGDVNVQRGARAIIHGTVTGIVRNDGYVDVNGKIGGLIDLSPEARSVIAPGAFVNGVRR